MNYPALFTLLFYICGGIAICFLFLALAVFGLFVAIGISLEYEADKKVYKDGNFKSRIGRVLRRELQRIKEEFRAGRTVETHNGDTERVSRMDGEEE